MKASKSTSQKFFFFFILGIAIWSCSILFSVFFPRILPMCIVFGGAAFSLTMQNLFVVTFVESAYQKILKTIIIALGGFFIIASFWVGAVFSDYTIATNGYIMINNGFLSHFYSLFVLIFITLPIITLHLAYRKQQERERKMQIKYLLYGFSIFFFVNLMTNSLLPVFFGIFFFNTIGPIFSVFLTIFTFIIIHSYNFLGIKVLIQRGFIYIILASLIIAFYLFLILTTGFIFHQSTPITAIISAGIATLFGVFTVPTVDKFLRRISNPWFFKDSYNFFDAVKKLNDISQSNIYMQDIVSKVDKELSLILGINNSAFISTQQNTFFQNGTTNNLQETFHDTEYNTILTTQKTIIKNNPKDTHEQILPWMHTHHFSLYQPIISNHAIIGGFFIGEKKSGEALSTKDVRLIEQLAHQLSASMLKAHLLDKEKKQSRILEQEVKVRTRQINEMQKWQESMMLDISHALKTPLAVLSADLNTLTISEKNINTSALQFSIDEVSRSISSLLKLSRMEYVDESASHALIDISSITELLCDHFAPLAAKKDIEITRDLTPNCHIYGSHNQIEDLIVNLLENAMTYMPKDQAIKKVSCTIQQSNDHITIKIEDSGKGVSQEDLAHIFERFYRAKEPYHKDISGTGLGLAICKKIVEAHKSTIIAQIAQQGGLIFTITFPQAKITPSTATEKIYTASKR